MSIISRFAGLTDAYAYAYGINPDAPPALQVLNGSTVSGTFTITCQNAVSSSGAVPSIAPTTSTPISIGFGTNEETVTPSAVSVDNLGNILITATFANAHSTGEQVRSGTYGLQEAINSASSQGGGIVLVSPAWFKAGGTQTIVDTAQGTLPAGVSVWVTNSEGAPSMTATVAVPNASVLTLNTVGVQLVPAQGAGSLIVVNSLVVEQVAKTAAFAGGPGNLNAAYGATSGSQVNCSGNIAATVLTGGAGTTNQIGLAYGSAPANANSSAYLNAPVWLYAASANPTTGGGSLIVKLSFNVLSGF